MFTGFPAIILGFLSVLHKHILKFRLLSWVAEVAVFCFVSWKQETNSNKISFKKCIYLRAQLRLTGHVLAAARVHRPRRFTVGACSVRYNF